MKERDKSSKPIHPGEILREEFMKRMGITQYRLAKDLSVKRLRISEIVRGKRGLRRTLRYGWVGTSVSLPPTG